MSSNRKMNDLKEKDLQVKKRKKITLTENSSDAEERYSLLLPCDEQKVLTECEMIVLSDLATGLQHKEIACRYGVSVYSVKDHTANIYRKLNVSNLIEAIIKYNNIIRNLKYLIS